MMKKEGIPSIDDDFNQLEVSQVFPAKISPIKSASSKFLVHYYPMAGWLSISSERMLIVDCTGDGDVCVEAEVKCEMEKIGVITRPDPVTPRKLVHDISPLVAQISIDDSYTSRGRQISICNYRLLSCFNGSDFS